MLCFRRGRQCRLPAAGADDLFRQGADPAAEADRCLRYFESRDGPEDPPAWAKWLRLVIKKHQLPTAINIYENESQPPVLSIKRGFTFLRAKLRVFAGDGRSLGYFRSKLISIGGGFFVFNHADQQVAEVKGNWKGWDFKFLNQSGREVGTVTKKWAGLGKELFTSADNCVISLTDLSGASPDAAALLLAAGLAIDVVYKETE